MKRWVGTGASVAFLAAALCAQGDGRGGPPWGFGPFDGRKPRLSSACMDGLGLNDSQKATLGELRQDLAAAIHPLVDERRSYRVEIDTALEAANPDPMTIGRMVIADHAVAAQIRAARGQFESRFTALLTADQLATFTALRENGVCGARGKRPR